MSQLPDYLRSSKRGRLAERASEGMGSLLPPHVSIKGNRFTLVDQSGGEKPIETLHLDVCVADMSDKMAKQYYGKDYEAGSSDPPKCWSADGVVPSKDAVEMQNLDCASCPHNRIGSAMSRLTGKPVKACRDEKWLAVLLVGIPGTEKMLFQFRVTPGSFKNFKAYSEKFKGREIDMKDVITRLSFQSDMNGVVQFETSNFVSAETAQIRELAYDKNSTDVFVGRTDSPATLASISPPTQAAPALAGPSVVENSPAKPRGRPKKEPQAAQPAPAAAPFADAPAQAPFGIQADAPEPPNQIAEGMKSFFNE